MLEVSDISNLSIDASHPCLPGHFPDQPIVPGVLLLDRVLDRAQQCLHQKLRVVELPVAKFTRPLLPGETATLHLEILDAQIKFEITKDDARIAQGSFRIDRGTSR